jgi:hypothetical protein
MVVHHVHGRSLAYIQRIFNEFGENRLSHCFTWRSLCASRHRLLRQRLLVAPAVHEVQHCAQPRLFHVLRLFYKPYNLLH